MRRTLSCALVATLFLIGCPQQADPPTVDERVPDLDAPGPPPEALDRPHTGAAGPTSAPSKKLKDPPPPDPGPPIGEPEELQPVDEGELAQDPEEAVDPKAWAFGPSKGAIDLFPGIRLYKDEERLEVNGRVCLKHGPTLELLGCTERGKTHESLLLFQCNPKQLHLALIMLGLKPSPQVQVFGEQKALSEGERVVLEVTWAAEHAPAEDTSAPEPAEGRITRRAEDLVYDQIKKHAMPRVGWVFTGSRNVMVPKPPDWDKKHEVYAAEYAGNVAAVYHDPDALLDTPLPEGGDDTVYVAYSDRLPARGTPVLLHLRKWKPGDGPDLAPAAAPGVAPGDQAPEPDEEAPDDEGAPDGEESGGE